MYFFFAVIQKGQWQPGIGDPTFMGWFTVVAYFTTSILCGYYATLATTKPLKELIRHSLLWWGIAVILLFLGINKQLDLQTLFTQVGREVAISFGLYEIRRVLQLFFILGLLVGSTISFAVLYFVFLKEFKNHFWALFGIVFLLFFIVVRASSFHHIDMWLSLNLKGFRLNWIFELGGIGCIAYSVLHDLYPSIKK